jgi:hypothetical protein
VIPPRFTVAEADSAYEEWGCNCGPTAIAAIMGLTLDELRPHLGDFERKRYTNPILMWEILDRLGARWRLVKPPRTWPTYGLARVQWEGPWTKPGVPMRARYRHTHWVGATWSVARNEFGIFDCNAMANGTGWCSAANWSGIIAPWILETCVPRADGRWHLTHVVEITLPGQPGGGAR